MRPALLAALARRAGLSSAARSGREPQLVQQVSLGPNGGNGACHDPVARRGSADGTRVTVRTREALAPRDTDTNHDIYQRSGRRHHEALVSAGGNLTRS